MRISRLLFASVAVLLGLLTGCDNSTVELSGALRQWHRITLTFDGPDTAELGSPNPFLDYRLDVTFSQGSRSVTVPGFYAADGNAAETGASTGSTWRVHFMPDAIGEWTWTAAFFAGPNVAIADDVSEGTPAAFDGASGSFVVEPTDKLAPDLRVRGRLDYVGRRYLRFAGTGEYFLKGGADSPENLLAFADFDNTTSGRPVGRSGEAAASLLHTYAPHAADWREGDPVWRDSLGKNLIGALNYLASEEMNSVYFLTMNVEGDGKDVFMWTDDAERLRFDCSKLDQWEIVFAHMTARGLMMHVVTQEQENDQLLDEGELGPQRRLYYRELVARFAHHPALVWNLGEENTNTDAQRKAFASYLRLLDPYDHPIVVHTFPGAYDEVYEPLLGYRDFEGPSLQMGEMLLTHAETSKWVQQSEATSRPWVVCLDEIGPAHTGVMPDGADSNQDQVRKYALWANLMAGGCGAEWYFGYEYPHNDLNCEDWRSRDAMWDRTRFALRFFQRHLPFEDMKPADELAGDSRNWVLAQPGAAYALYLPEGGDVSLDLTDDPGPYDVQWYNPRTGQFVGETVTVEGGTVLALGPPPSEPVDDWAVLLRR